MIFVYIAVSFGLGVGFADKVKAGLSALWSMFKTDASAKLAEVKSDIEKKV